MAGYEQHIADNVKTVNKLIKAKMVSETEKNSLVRPHRSPKSLQAGAFYSRKNSLIQSDVPTLAKQKVSVSKKNEEAIKKEKLRAEARELRNKINAQKAEEAKAKRVESLKPPKVIQKTDSVKKMPIESEKVTILKSPTRKTSPERQINLGKQPHKKLTKITTEATVKEDPFSPTDQQNSAETYEELRVLEPKPKQKMLTFEDIQKMNFTLLRQSGDKDDFKPSDLVDIESGDSDNEILARFKSQKQLVQKTGIYKSEF